MQFLLPRSPLIVFDGDFGCKTLADPDDCLGLHMLKRLGAHVAFVIAGKGNVPSDEAYKTALSLTDLPVHREVRDCTSSAISALRAATREEKVTVLAMGALTNVAKMLRCDPALAERIEEVVFVGGRRVGQRFIPNRHWPLVELRDLNVETDPPAVADILASSVHLRLVPFEAGNAVPLRVWGSDLAKAHLPAGLLGRLRAWSTLSSVVWGTDGVLPFDPVAVVYTLWPEEFTCDRVHASVQGNRLEVRLDALKSHTEYCLPKNPERVRTLILSSLH